MMKILVIGSGGREHALCWGIKKSRGVSRLYCAPGNGGTAEIAHNVPIAAHQIEELAAFALRERIGLTVVGPELPLTLGIVDVFEKKGLAIIGPKAAAARLEGSKIFAKEFMQRHGIPTSPFEKTSSWEQALKIVRSGRFGYPVVLKADGLAAGKGVIVARNEHQAETAIHQLMVEKTLGVAGENLLIEQFLEGVETSFLVFSDGQTALPMVATQDHKTVFDNDEGPNTGGMGAYSTDEILKASAFQEVMERIVNPTIQGMEAEGTPYRGILYAGLMSTKDGLKVLEYNTRFGDPETQPILFRLNSDLVEVFEGICSRDLGTMNLQWTQDASVCVVLAAGGYPGDFEKGKTIRGIPEAESLAGVKVFHAGTENRNGCPVSTGGRVLGVTAKAENLSAAISVAYQAVGRIHFDHMHFRRDIGRKGLRRESLLMKADS
ncbi:MAG: phosphoribosylamine--glycine ligase [Terriglobia bacterium]